MSSLNWKCDTSFQPFFNGLWLWCQQNSIASSKSAQEVKCFSVKRNSSCISTLVRPGQYLVGSSTPWHSSGENEVEAFWPEGLSLVCIDSDKPGQSFSCFEQTEPGFFRVRRQRVHSISLSQTRKACMAHIHTTNNEDLSSQSDNYHDVQSDTDEHVVCSRQTNCARLIASKSIFKK